MMKSSSERQNIPITSWRKFARHIRPHGCSLLKRLNEFPRSILITGCQRSGTTMLSRIITNSDGMVNYYFGRDDELDAALILAGWVPHQPKGRYCFQTTYVNECVYEYINIDPDHRIVWVLRNPFSVIYSLLYNWRRWTLNELFMGCGVDLLSAEERRRVDRFGLVSISRIKKACLSYAGKVSQLDFLVKHLADRLCVVDYDELVKRKLELFPQIYSFIDLDYNNSYTKTIHSKSITKQKHLSRREIKMVEQICVPVYDQYRKLITIG